MGAVLSPSGNRLALLLDFPTETSGGLTDVLARLLHEPRYGRMGIFVAAVGATSSHEVGWLPEEPQTVSEKSTIAGLRWLPDGRRISYWYHDRIWTVPVDCD